MDVSGPIGIFDSGVGGLSVLREIRRELPDESSVYVADSGFAPYGERDADFIIGRSETIVRFLIDRGAKAIVVACNTATSIAVEQLRATFAQPIVAIEPAIKPAAAITRSGTVGVLATSATVASARVAALIERQAGSVRPLLQPCPGLVEQVEAGDLDGPATRALIERYVAPLVAQGADTLVLGCTHYAFLRPVIEEVAGSAVTVVDPAAAVARELSRRLDARGLRRSSPSDGNGVSASFWSSGAVDAATRVIGKLWAHGTAVHGLPRECCVAPISRVPASVETNTHQ